VKDMMKAIDSPENQQIGLWGVLGEDVAARKLRVRSSQKQPSSPALDPDDQSLVLWAESPAEARNFLSRAAASGVSLPIEKIFVAKRSPETRTNTYIGGRYHPATNDEAVNVYEQVVYAPPAITDLVQWCACDIMLSYGGAPCVVLEDTTHIVRMNLYQRIPRLARAANLGVPSLVLQGTRGLNLQLRGDRWGLYRYLQAFEAIARIYPRSPSLPVWYLPEAAEERIAQDFVLKHISAILNGDTYTVESQRAQVISNIRSCAGYI
jgi:hypothetical protein